MWVWVERMGDRDGTSGRGGVRAGGCCYGREGGEMVWKGIDHDHHHHESPLTLPTASGSG